MIENIMEHIAWKVKKDPVQVRLNNISGDSEMKKFLPEFVKSVGKKSTPPLKVASKNSRIFQIMKIDAKTLTTSTLPTVGSSEEFPFYL